MTTPFSRLRNELYKKFDKKTRKKLVNILRVPPVDQDDLKEEAGELIDYLDKSKYIDEKDVSRFLKVVTDAKFDDWETVFNRNRNFL
jgi:hypothetical protein